MRYGVAKLGRGPKQVVVPAELRSDVSSHCLWNWGTTSVFEIRIVNLDMVPYLRMMTKKVLEKAER